MRYFYTYPLEVVWMAKEFGFKFFSEEPRILLYDSANDILGNFVLNDDSFDLDCFTKFYIHPDCHAMLEPQVGDLCWWDMHLGGKCLAIATPLLIMQGGCLEIIQRNGKAWFTPEIEI